jgi:hypothetical protein
MKKMLKHRFLALWLTLGLASVIGGAAVSATCSGLIISRLSDGGFQVCELVDQWITSDGTEICAYVCNDRYLD